MNHLYKFLLNTRYCIICRTDSTIHKLIRVHWFYNDNLWNSTWWPLFKCSYYFCCKRHVRSHPICHCSFKLSSCIFFASDQINTNASILISEPRGSHNVDNPLADSDWSSNSDSDWFILLFFSTLTRINLKVGFIIN